ncbi:MAG: hypothetical protein P8J37_12875 [Fuerstiella sp.]|nr:hypothetical protein [Fuerstiella sp.]
MSEKGAQWAKQRFSWQAIGLQMIQFYDWLLTGGQPPDYMHDTLRAA